MSLTTYGENQMLTLFDENTTYYLALFTGDPGETGDTSAEVDGTAYERQEVTFSSASGGSMASSDDIEFPAATSDWGTVTHWGLCDASTEGNVWWTGSITVPKLITSGDIYRVPAGYLTLSLD